MFCAEVDTATSVDFALCLEQALTARTIPRIAKPAIIAIFCWRDQDESKVPVKELLVFVAFVVDFQIVDILSPPCGWRRRYGGSRAVTKLALLILLELLASARAKA